MSLKKNQLIIQRSLFPYYQKTNQKSYDVDNELIILNNSGTQGIPLVFETRIKKNLILNWKI